MSAFPSLPLFTDAFIADTGHLSAQETGAFLMLLMMAWRSPDCQLPDDDDRLARWARVDRRTWARIKPIVMEFWTLANGTWTQKRLSKERDHVSKRAEVARENGQQGGRPKPLKMHNVDNPMGSSRVSKQKAPNPNPNDASLRSASDAAAPKKGLRLADDWVPSEQDLQIGRDLGFTDADMRPIYVEFRDYWRAESGQKARKCDWSLTWRNRLRELAARRRPPPSSGPRGRPVGPTMSEIATSDLFQSPSDEPRDRSPTELRPDPSDPRVRGFAGRISEPNGEHAYGQIIDYPRASAYSR